MTDNNKTSTLLRMESYIDDLGDSPEVKAAMRMIAEEFVEQAHNRLVTDKVRNRLLEVPAPHVAKNKRHMPKRKNRFTT